MMKKLALALSVVVLTGCVAPGGNRPSLAELSIDRVNLLADETSRYLESGKKEAEAIEAAKASAANQLKDPDSAKFRSVEVKVYQGRHIICGEINGKNSYGGYVGYLPFAASPTDAVLEERGSRYPHIDEMVNTGLRRACGY